MQHFSRAGLLIAVSFFPALQAADVPGNSSPAGNTPAYGRWVERGDLQRLVDELNRLTDDADRYNAANSRFIRDLRKLANRYDWPWRVRILHDDFRDGDYTVNPAWIVDKGRFWVDRNYGLRTIVEIPVEPGKRGRDPSDLGELLLDALLDELDRNRRDDRKGDRRRDTGRAVIHTKVAITNAFAVELELTSQQRTGRIEVGLYRGKYGDGYRLAYNPGERPVIELLRIHRRGAGVIHHSDLAYPLEDGRAHSVAWTRDGRGNMMVRLDGRTIIVATDLTYKERFDGFVLVNRGGDYSVQRITVSGTSLNR